MSNTLLYVWILFSGLGAQASTLLIDGRGDGQGNLLESPSAVGVDSFGHTFVVGSFSNNVFRVDPDGSIHEILDATGDGQGGVLDRPTFMEVDRATGTVYVSETTGIFRVSLDGTITKIVDSSPLVATPGDLALDAFGNLYATGRSSRTAVRIRPDLTIDLLLTASGDGQSGVIRPVGIDVDSQGNVYVVGGEFFLARVFRISSRGDIDLLMDESTLGLSGGWGVVVDPMDNVYVSECSYDVFRIDPTGNVSVAVDQFGAGPGQGHFGSGPMASDAFGNVFVPSFGFVGVPGNLLQVAPDGTVTVVDTHGLILDDIAPYGIDCDPAGNIVLGNLLNDTVYPIQACAPASSSLQVRNGSGTNPAGFAAPGAPVLGQTWTCTVDLSSSGASMSVLVLSLNPTTLAMPTPFGELLCRPPYVLTRLASGSHEVLIPNDCSLSGRALSAQAAAVFTSPSGWSSTTPSI